MSMLSNIGIVNAHFNRWETVRLSPRRWFGLHLGIKGLLMSLLLMKQRLFIGFSNYHTEQAYLKSTFNEIWQKEPEYLKNSCTRFREDIIANPYLFRYWQFAKNTFYPKKRKFATFHFWRKNMLDDIEKALKNTNIASICLNDSSMCTDEEFDIIDNNLIRMLNQKFPDKSSFEI